jgi:uncharacterized protein YdhG (YjbR/CyaY superfamily)
MAEKAKTAGLSKEERDAVKQRAAELRAQEKAGKSRAAGEKAISEVIGKMPDDDRAIAEGLDRLVKDVAPDLIPRTYYGMPAYTNADGKNVVFFQAASKFTVRYATIGFEHGAQLDDGDVWPTHYAVLAWSTATEELLRERLTAAAGV